MKKTAEGLLRDWLRSTMGDVSNIDWVEPSRGSSVGLPDCNLRFGNVTIPVELKAWKVIKGQIKGEMRPAQIRYHFMAAREKRRTAILYSIPSAVGFDVFLLPGKYVPLADKVVNREASQPVGTKELCDYKLLSRTILSSSFWEQ